MSDDFYWKECGGLKLLVSKKLEDAGFANGFSTRLGGVSPFPENDLNLAGFDEDTEENIFENRRRFLSLFDDEYKLTSVWQVHGDGIKTVRSADDAANTEDKFDALVSDLPKLLAGVKTADCVPILIGDKKTRAFGAVHAGWKGTVESIVSKAVDKMRSEYGSDPGDLCCAIGPAACGRNYEIGAEVIEAFRRAFSTSGKLLKETSEGHALIDLHLANQDQLISGGVPESSISIAPYCTMERTDLFFSYRMEKKLHGRTGRLISAIGQRAT